jgi:hypothetical protein
MNVHMPTRRWQRAQCSITFSGCLTPSTEGRGEANDIREGVTLGRRTGVDGSGTGVLSLVPGSDAIDGARETLRIDIADPGRVPETVRPRSTVGGLGGAGDQPNRPTMTAVSEASGIGISVIEGEGEGGASPT